MQLQYLVDSSMINAKFVSYNDQALPPVCLCLPDVMHVTKSPRPSPLFCNLHWRWEQPWNEAKGSICQHTQNDIYYIA